MHEYDIWYAHGRPVLMKDKKEMTLKEILTDLKEYSKILKQNENNYQKYF